jgi:hypothetical protein
MSTVATTLARQIEAAHQAAIGAAQTAIERTTECGKLLLEAKKQVGRLSLADPQPDDPRPILRLARPATGGCKLLCALCRDGEG